MRPMLEHVLAGVQYALGDLKATDRAEREAEEVTRARLSRRTICLREECSTIRTSWRP